jgi:hypothetical protein
MLHSLYSAYRDGAKKAQAEESATWRKAAAEGRLKVRKQRGQNIVCVSIEPALFAAGAL